MYDKKEITISPTTFTFERSASPKLSCYIISRVWCLQSLTIIRFKNTANRQIHSCFSNRASLGGVNSSCVTIVSQPVTGNVMNRSTDWSLTRTVRSWLLAKTRNLNKKVVPMNVNQDEEDKWNRLRKLL